MSEEIVNLGGPTIPPTEPTTPAEPAAPVAPAADESELAILADQLQQANNQLQAAGIVTDHADRNLDAIRREKAALTAALGGPERVRQLAKEKAELDSIRELSRTVDLTEGSTMANINMLEREALRRGDQAEFDRLQKVKLDALMKG